MYSALYAYRMKRADTIKALSQEQLRYSKLKACEALTTLRASLKTLMASEGYQKANLKSRLELRKVFDDFIRDQLADDGDPCLG